MATIAAAPCTLTLTAPYPQQAALIVSGTNPFYVGHSSTSTVQTASSSNGSFLGSHILTITEKTGIQSITVTQADTNNSMTAYVAPTTIGQAVTP